jgi:hypothetical protein
MNRPAINAFALAPVAAETRTALDDALAQVILLDTKHMDGRTLTDDESRQYGGGRQLHSGPRAPDSCRDVSRQPVLLVDSIAHRHCA